MKALTYHGAKDVRVETMPDPRIESPDDIILRVTATAICGSDLHLYRGKMPGLKDGDILGHEFMGVVEEAGSDVTRVKRGDRVVIPFVIACGQCFFCAHEQFACCDGSMQVKSSTVNGKGISSPPPLFGYTHLFGGVPGGQAELVRVPKANVGPFAVPGSLAMNKCSF